jgi:hypothetical protein
VLALLLITPCLYAGKGAYAADPSNDQLVEAPTAYTLLHGGYQVMLRMYDGGGLFLRGDIGFQKFLQFGFSGNATNVIGHGTIEVQEPRLAIKVKPFSQGKVFPFTLAAGWDDRGYGLSSGRRFMPGTQKGLYVALSREFQSLRGLQLHGGANLVRVGRNYDSSSDAAAFGGVAIGFSNSFHLNLEVDKVFTEQWQFNGGLLVGNGAPLRVGLDFRDINRSESFARLLRIQYLGFF